MKNIKLILLMCAGLMGVSAAHAQQRTPEEVKRMVESKHFIFKAESAIPVRGGSRMLSAGYDVVVSNSKVVSYLPFYGRAQTVPISGDGGIKFTSNDFDYKAVNRKKKWLVTLNMKDVANVQQLYLTVYDNGNAILDVMNIHRDNISFRGYISDVR